MSSVYMVKTDSLKSTMVMFQVPGIAAMVGMKSALHVQFSETGQQPGKRRMDFKFRKRTAYAKCTPAPKAMERVWFRLDHLTVAILVTGQAGCTPWCQSATSVSQLRQGQNRPTHSRFCFTIFLLPGVGKIKCPI